jgi:hypothetical protein
VDELTRRRILKRPNRFPVLVADSRPSGGEATTEVPVDLSEGPCRDLTIPFSASGGRVADVILARDQGRTST